MKLYDVSFQKAFVRKKTLDPARKMVQRNTIDPFDKVLQLAIAYMPDFFQMSDEDAAHWKEFESALTKDFKQFVAYRFLEDKEMANAKAKDVNDKARVSVRHFVKLRFSIMINECMVLTEKY